MGGQRPVPRDKSGRREREKKEGKREKKKKRVRGKERLEVSKAHLFKGSIANVHRKCS